MKMETEKKRKFYLRKVRLNSGGYDRSGKYWGMTNLSLYHYSCDPVGSLLAVDAHLRASGRDAAKAEILERYPDATFFNDRAFKADRSITADAYGKGIQDGIQICLDACESRYYVGIVRLLKNVAMTLDHMPKDAEYRPALVKADKNND